MARIELNIVALGDFKQVQSQIAQLRTQVNLLNKEIGGTTLGSDLSRQLNNLQSQFKSTMLSTGQFTEQTVKLRTETEKFGQSLVTGKLRLSDYYNIIRSRSSDATKSVQALAVEQVKLNNSIVSADPLKKGVFSVYTPTKINEMAKATEIAAMKQNLYNIAVQQGSQKLIDFGKNTQWAGRQLTVGLSLPVAMFGRSAMQVFQQVNDELVRMQKVYGTGLVQPTAAAIQLITKQVTGLAVELAKTWGVAAKDTASMAADLAAVGLQGTNLLGATREAMRLQKLGEMDTQTAMQTTISLQNVYKLNTQQLSGAINFLNAVENQTSTSLQDLAAGIPKVGPIVQQLGGSFKDTAVMMVAMKEAGIPAAQSANAIKSALASLINPSKNASDAFAKYNINLASIATTTQGNPIKMIEMLQKSMAGLAPLAKAQLIEKLFGKFQEARISALISNLGSLNSQTKIAFDLANASESQLAGVAANEMKVATESTTGKFKRAIETLKADLLPAGEKIMEIATKLLDFGNSVSKVFSSLPGPIKSGLGILLAAGALAGPIIMLTGLMANFVGYIVKTAFNIKNLITGTKTFGQLFTPEIIASRNAAELFGNKILEDVGSVDLLNSAIGRLTIGLEGMVAAMNVDTGAGIAAIAAQIPETIPTNLPTRIGILSQVTREEAIKAFGSRQKVGEARVSKPTSGAYIPLELSGMNTPMSHGGVQSSEYIAAMTQLTGETQNEAKMFRTTYTKYFAAIGKMTNSSKEQLITQENIDKILAQINSEYKAELLEMQRMYDLTGEEQYLLTDINNPLAQIAQKVIRMNAELSADPAAFTRMFNEWNVASSKSHPTGKTSGGTNTMYIQDPTWGKQKILLSVKGDKTMLLHSMNEEFLIFRDNFIKNLRATYKEAGLVLDETLVTEMSASLRKAAGIAERTGEDIGRAIELGIAKGLVKQGVTTEEIAKMDLTAMGESLIPIAEREGMKSGQAFAIAMERTMIAPSTASAMSIASPARGIKNKLGKMGSMGSSMGIGMGAMMAAPYVGKIGGGNNAIAGAAGSALGAVGMVSMAGMFLEPEVMGPLMGVVAAGALAYSGIKRLMEIEKQHQAEAKATFAASSDAASFFGNKIVDLTTTMNNYNASFASSAGSSITQNATELQSFITMVKSLQSDNPLSLLIANLKGLSNTKDIEKIAQEFVTMQLAIGNIKPEQAQKFLDLILGSSGHSALIGSVLPTVKTQLKAITTSLNSAAGNTQQFNQALGSMLGLLGNSSTLVDFNGILDAIVKSLGNGSAAVDKLLSYYRSIGDIASTNVLESLKSLGFNPKEIGAIQKAANAGAQLEYKSKDSLLKQANDYLQLHKDDLKTTTAINSALTSTNNTLSIQNDKNIAKAKSLQLQKDSTDKQLKQQKDITSELQKQQDYRLTQSDLDNQIRVAQASGDFLKASLLMQQKNVNASKYSSTNAQDTLQSKSDALGIQIAALKDIIDTNKTKIDANVQALTDNTAAVNANTLVKGGITDLPKPGSPTAPHQIDSSTLYGPGSKGLNAKIGAAVPTSSNKDVQQIIANLGYDLQSTGLDWHMSSSAMRLDVKALAKAFGYTKKGDFFTLSGKNNSELYEFEVIDDKGNIQLEGRGKTGQVWSTAIGKFIDPVKKSIGGHVTGPGSWTSDSIPAMLSNGEYVANSSAVSKYGVSFMDSINNKSYNPSFPNPAVNSSIPSGSGTIGSTYNITVNAGSNASADDIAKTVISTIKRQNAMTSTMRSVHT